MKAVLGRDGQNLPRFVQDASFVSRSAPKKFDPSEADDGASFAGTFMPDEVTRDTAKRMHYAAYRLKRSRSREEAVAWRRTYIDLRDRIVVGNSKLAYRAVRRRMAMSNHADDLIGDCHIVLIHAVAAYNPWLGIRFSTYAFTCLLRALARLAQRATNDWFSRSASLDALPNGEPAQRGEVENHAASAFQIDEFLRDDHPLLSQREKMILTLRFRMAEGIDCPTLENVGRELGLSKDACVRFRPWRLASCVAYCSRRKSLIDEMPAVL